MRNFCEVHENKGNITFRCHALRSLEYTSGCKYFEGFDYPYPRCRHDKAFDGNDCWCKAAREDALAEHALENI